MMYYLKYSALCMGIYLVLAGTEILVFHPLADFFGSSYRAHLVFYLILLLAIDPLLTKILSEKIRKRYEKEEGEQI